MIDLRINIKSKEQLFSLFGKIVVIDNIEEVNKIQNREWGASVSNSIRIIDRRLCLTSLDTHVMCKPKVDLENFINYLNREFDGKVYRILTPDEYDFIANKLKEEYFNVIF